MGEIGCLGGERKDSAPKKEFNSEIWGKGVCDIWEKWVSGWRNKRLQKENSNLRYGEKGVCDIWEKWVVWVEKSNAFWIEARTERSARTSALTPPPPSAGSAARSRVIASAVCSMPCRADERASKSGWRAAGGAAAPPQMACATLLCVGATWRSAWMTPGADGG